MQKNYLSILIFSISLFTSLACSKEEIMPLGNEHLTRSERSLISKEVFFLAGKDSKQWKADKYIINNQDLTNILFKECSLDNIQTFERSGNYIEVEGPTKCDPSAPDVYDSGIWALSEDKTHLTVNSPHLQGINFEIIELKPNSLKVQYLDPNAGIIQIWLVPAKHASI